MKKQKKKEDNKTINLSNEIIIGITPKKQEVKNKNVSKRNIKNKKSIKKKPQKKKVSSKRTTKTIKKSSKKKTIRGKIVKWTSLVLLIILCITLFLLSSVFNIKEIIVKNNYRTSKEEIINLSGLNINENMFKTINSKISSNLKTNPYIQNVKIQKRINGIVELEILERKATYMIQYANTYAYISNQGYILELSEEPINFPILTGITTPEEEIKLGNRLRVEDLEKLGTVIKIVSNCNSKGIGNLISTIDITDSNNYKLVMATELKTVYFGDVTSINEKVLWIKDIVEKKKGIEGEIFVKNPEKNVYFRAKV